MSKVTIIGVDMALSNMGLARAEIDLSTDDIHIDELKLVTTQKIKDKRVRASADKIIRGRQLYEALCVFSRDAHLMVAEVPSGAQSAAAASALGLATGILACAPLPLIQVSQQEVKLASIGRKKATKAEIIEWATSKHPEANWLTQKRKGKLRLLNSNEHLADAVSALYAAIQTDQYAQAVALWRGMAKSA